MTEEDKKHLSEELNLKVILLQQRIAVLDELLLHRSRKLNAETAKFYVRAIGRYGHFFNAVTNSLTSSFYVELLSLLGVKLNRKGEIINDKWATASVYTLALAHNSQNEYLAIIAQHKGKIDLIDEVRHHIAHAKKLEDLNNLRVPGYFQVVELLNDVSGFIMKLHDESHGIPGWNTPHILTEKNDYADDTEELLNAISLSEKSKIMREKYLQAKDASRKTSVK